MILIKQGRRYYYCHHCFTDEETRVKEYFKGHVFEPRQELRPPQLGCWLEHLHQVSPWGLGFLTTWQLVSQDKEPGRCRISFSNPALEVIQCHFCCILFTINNKSWPGSRGGEIDSSSWWRRGAMFLKCMWEWKYCYGHFWKIPSATLSHLTDGGNGAPFPFPRECLV